MSKKTGGLYLDSWLSVTNRNTTEDLFALDSSNVGIDMGLALNQVIKLFLEVGYSLGRSNLRDNLKIV
jgi:hypothetical protein